MAFGAAAASPAGVPTLRGSPSPAAGVGGAGVGSAPSGAAGWRASASSPVRVRTTLGWKVFLHTRHLTRDGLPEVEALTRSFVLQYGQTTDTDIAGPVLGSGGRAGGKLHRTWR